MPLAQAIQQAVFDLQEAEAFFDQATSHQFDFANAWLTSAREKVNMLLKQAKQGGDKDESQSYENGAYSVRKEAEAKKVSFLEILHKAF
jgi:hypothetical protein